MFNLNLGRGSKRLWRVDWPLPTRTGAGHPTCLIGGWFQFFLLASRWAARLILTRELQTAICVQRKCTLGAPSLSYRRVPFLSAPVKWLRVKLIGVRSNIWKFISANTTNCILLNRQCIQDTQQGSSKINSIQVCFSQRIEFRFKTVSIRLLSRLCPWR